MNDGFAKAVLQALDDFLAAVADDFSQPNAAVHVHEQGAPVQIGGLRVGGDDRVNQRVPHLDDLGLGLPGVEPQILQQRGQHVAGPPRGRGAGDFQRRVIHAAPLRQNPGAGGGKMVFGNHRRAINHRWARMNTDYFAEKGRGHPAAEPGFKLQNRSNGPSPSEARFDSSRPHSEPPCQCS